MRKVSYVCIAIILGVFALDSVADSASPVITIRDKGTPPSSVVISNRGTDNPDISLHDHTPTEAVKIIVHSAYEPGFLSLKVEGNVFTLSEALIRAISAYDLVDTNGVAITHVDVNPDHNVILGISGGTSEILSATPTPEGVKLIASFQENNQFIDPQIHRVGVYDLKGKKLCHQFDNRSVKQQQLFTLLLDRSGSMLDHLSTVKKTAKQFLSQGLPSNAVCGVIEFGDQWNFTHENYQRCADGVFNIDAIKLNGLTDFFGPLNAALSDFNSAEFEAFQKTIIIVTDGYSSLDAKQKQILQHLKSSSSALILTYFIGGNSRQSLDDISDHFFSKEDNLDQELTAYLRNLGDGFGMQKVLNVSECNPDNTVTGAGS